MAARMKIKWKLALVFSEIRNRIKSWKFWIILLHLLKGFESIESESIFYIQI